MLIALLSSLFLITATTFIHYEVLRVVYRALPGLHIPQRYKILIVIFGSFIAHFIEIALYAASLYTLIRFFHVGTLTGSLSFSLENCMYFSAETFTSLGFGDITPSGPVRLLVGVETLNGLLLIGWSASFSYIAMERFWNDTEPDKSALQR